MYKKEVNKEDLTKAIISLGETRICEFTGKEYNSLRIVKCKCECHGNPNMIHFQPCCYRGITFEKIYLT